VSRYAQDRDAKFRGGVRILLAAAVIPITWFIVWIGLFAASGPWVTRRVVSLRDLVLWFLVGLLTITALVLVVGLFRGAHWRWAASGAWSGVVVVTAVLIGLPSATGWEGGVAFGLAGVGIAGAYAWTLMKFDPPAT
jgi:hypothetical protein